MTRLEILRRRHGTTVPQFDHYPSSEAFAMSFTSSVRVPTSNASRYLQQLCKHWGHNLTVEFDERKGEVVFPHNARGADWPGDGKLSMQAHDDGLECWLEASAAGQLDGLKGAVSRHLDRFAFREAPLRFEWHDR